MQRLKKQVRMLKNCFIQYDSKHFFKFSLKKCMRRIDLVWEIIKYTASYFRPFMRAFDFAFG